jgi:hypothetical protein
VTPASTTLRDKSAGSVAGSRETAWYVEEIPPAAVVRVPQSSHRIATTIYSMVSAVSLGNPSPEESDPSLVLDEALPRSSYEAALLQLAET